ncbi:MAG: M20/M25/M40 family metallo-hydrolase [Sphaerochaetaceae bacterium]|jgi:tripeptide aminopeptidase
MESRTTQIFMELIKINSPSKEEQTFRDHIIKRLENLNFKVQQDSYGNVTATLGSFKQKPIMLCCHLDTVPNAVDVNASIVDGTIVTDKSSALGADDKSGIAAILAAVEELQQNNIDIRDLIVLFTVEEEIGLEGIKNYDLSNLKEIEAGYVLDASGPIGTVVVASPSKTDSIITFNGKAAHAGFTPEKGISAIAMASSAIDKMKMLRINDDTTANIGTIAGGVANNVVSEKCVVTTEVRSLSEESAKAQLAHMELCCIKAIGQHGGYYTFESKTNYPSYKIDQNDKTVLSYKKVCDNLNIPFSTKFTGGGSDTNIMRNNNLPVITVTNGYENAHSVNEEISLEQLNKLTEVVKEIVTLKEN